MLFIPEPGAAGFQIAIPVTENMLDQVKTGTSYFDMTEEHFDHYIYLDIIKDGKRIFRKVTIALPNPWQEKMLETHARIGTMLKDAASKRYGNSFDIEKAKGQPGWWTWNINGEEFQYGMRDRDEVRLLRYFGEMDYNAGLRETNKAVKELNKVAGKAGKFTTIDNYFIIEAKFSPDTITSAKLEKKMEEFDGFSQKPELSA
uniref:hypothetical protein n=1 Tax=uncultured Flavobacterium sp. TaxID=165435 RepID=UPI0025EE3FC6